ncbi:MAG TPA: Spy/CpxP family protein refolding chaperone [Steroidobacteraceae bacterium]|nr:Spy/CpxP family protein refolding chaperone [Steroidobacteraceae bacterium]
MKSIRNLLAATLMTAGAVLASAAGMSFASAAAQTTGTDPSAVPGPGAAPGSHEWHRHGGPWHLLGKLGLNEAQKQQIKDIMGAARPQMQSLHEQMHANSLKLAQMPPTDPNYANVAAQVSQTHGSLTAQVMAQHADVRAQVFKVLTPAQQTQLTALEAQMRAHKHGPHGPGPAESSAP